MPLLLSLMARAGDKSVVARAVLLLTRCVSKHPAPTEAAALLASLGGFGRLLGLLPAAVEPAMALAEPAAVTSDDCQLLEAAARLLAAAAVASIEAAEAIATAKGGLLAVVGLHKRRCARLIARLLPYRHGATTVRLRWGRNSLGAPGPQRRNCDNPHENT